MDETSRNLSRRKFMAASSSAIAAPIIMNMAGKVPEAKAAEKTEATSSEKMGFFINDNCICCEQRCISVCPQKAISFDGDIYVIDNQKCVQCRTCMGVCNMDAIIDPNAEPPVHKPHPIIRRNCDFLVLGGGTSGLVAAAIAAEVSGKKVIVLEKAKNPGGSGMYAGGFKLWSSKWQLDAGAPDQMDDYIRSAMNATRWELNPQLVANSFRALPAFFDWFCTWGKPEELYQLVEGRVKGTWSVRGKPGAGIKSTPLMKKLIDRCTELGVEILTEHAATDFIMGDRGEISGVKAKDPGGTTFFNCKYCLVSTGNVISCGPLMQRCCPDYAQALIRRVGHRLPSNSGDGVVMAEKAGIPIDYKSVCITYIGILQDPFAGFSTSGAARGDALFINLNGERFVNETFADGDYYDFTWITRKQPKNTFYLVMDSKVLAAEPVPPVSIDPSVNRGGRNVEAGVPDPNEKVSTTKPYEQQKSPEDLKKIAAMSDRHVVIADTIEELADKLGMDRKTFVATVKRYNELCAKGHDDDYYKPARYMLPVEKGPFYALNYFLAMDGANGGLAINENMQVMGHDGPVEGLYAAGDTTGSRFTNHDGERTEIVNDMTWAVASGFLAGQNVGKQLKAV